MKILSIETSCDETAVSVIEAEGGLENPTFVVLGNALYSQIATHREFGGVFPMLAKREHAKNLPHLILSALTEAGLADKTTSSYNWQAVEPILSKEAGLYEGLVEKLSDIQAPAINLIIVTAGPGLEPALWVGISCAKALGTLWGIPVRGVNHMEGHIASILTQKTGAPVAFPALALLISGGHTELVEIQTWGEYAVIGETRDDAVGEAFDKVARMLDLPYPGGPEISKIADMAREKNLPQTITLPRPMIHSKDLDFSFSGIKTAVLYYIRDHGTLDDTNKMILAREFEDAVTEVLYKKTTDALEKTNAQTLIVAGGVVSNNTIRNTFLKLQNTHGIHVEYPTTALATDNAVMIGCAGYIQTFINPHPDNADIKAVGNLRLSTKKLT